MRGGGEGEVKTMRRRIGIGGRKRGEVETMRKRRGMGRGGEGGGWRQ